MNKKALTEADIRTKFITPAIVGTEGEKWDVMAQIREEAYFTKGRVIVRGKTVQRGEAKKADQGLRPLPWTGAGQESNGANGLAAMGAGDGGFRQDTRRPRAYPMRR